MATIPLEWTVKIKGASEVKTTLDQLNAALKAQTISREQYNKALAQGNRVATQSLNVDRYQSNITKAQFPALQKVSRAISTVTSISRSLLTISNALNLAKLTSNAQDEASRDAQLELNRLLRERQQMIDAGIASGPAWIQLNEDIAIATDNLNKSLQEAKDQKWDQMITGIETAVFGIGTIFTNLMNNKTISKAVISAATKIGGVFGSVFAGISSVIISAANWITTALTGKTMTTATTGAATKAGGLFGITFGTAAAAGIVAAGVIILAGTADLLLEAFTGESFVRQLTEKLIGKGQGFSVKDMLGLNVVDGADISGKGLFAGPNNYEEYMKGSGTVGGGSSFKFPDNKKDIEKQVENFEPFKFLFTDQLPQAFGETELKLEDSMTNVIPTTITTNAPVIIEAFRSMWNGVIAITNTAGAGIVAGVNSIFGSLISAMNSAIRAYNSAASRLRQSSISMLSFSPGTFSPISSIATPAIKAATGFDGMVNRPTMFLAGEAGPEQVSITPNGGGRSGGSTLIINVGGSVVTERKLAQIVDQYQKQNLKSRGFTGFG